MAPGSILIPFSPSARSARSRSSGVIRAFGVPLKVRSRTIASPIIASRGRASMEGLSLKKWWGESMWVPAWTVISTMLETKPFSSHLTIGVSLK